MVSAFCSGAAQVIGRTASGIAGSAPVAIPTFVAGLATFALVARGLSNMSGIDLTKGRPADKNFVTRNIIYCSPFSLIKDNDKGLTTGFLVKIASVAAVMAVAIYKGASCCAYGNKALNDASWLLRNALPMQLAKPTLFGLSK